jgi:3-methyladenine DNA glycosylase Tag
MNNTEIISEHELSQKISEILKKQGCAHNGGDSCYCSDARELGTCEYVIRKQLRGEG